ncbi:hypothetical protein V6C31_01550, partial [Caldibacillus debilis]|uniref:hypothetical protein n=1 Tax=Caldibacillus debilis TaxID=301148 RepID=UPI002FD9270A
FDPLTNDFVTLQFFFAQWNSLLSHTDIFTEALQYDNITDEQHFIRLRLTQTFSYVKMQMLWTGAPVLQPRMEGF